MAAGYKVRLGDGSEIGPLDMDMVRSWYQGGLIDADSPVQRAGTNRWTTLGEAVDLKSWGGGSSSKKSGGSGKKAIRSKDASGRSARADSDDSGDVTINLALNETWGTRLAGVLFLVLALGAGFLAWKPESTLPAFDGAPWLEIALGFVAFALATIPGWEIGRKLTRVGALLGAIALLPLTGILLAQGLRGTTLGPAAVVQALQGPHFLFLGCAWVVALGLFAFLADPAPRWLKAGLCLLLIGGAGYGLARFGFAPETDEQRQVREWSTPDRSFTDPSLGVSFEVPRGWVMLKKDSPVYTPPPEAKVALANPRLSGFGYFVAESAPAGIASLNQYLDRSFETRRKTNPSLKEVSRAEASVGTLKGQRAVGSWDAAGARYRDVTTVWKDGWVYYALVSFVPESPAATDGDLDALADGVATTGTLAGRLQKAIQSVTLEIPHLSPAAAETLMGRSEARVLEPDQAFRRAFDALSRAIPSWSAAESKELAQLLNSVYASLSYKDRGRLGSWVDRVRGGQLTTPEDDKEMCQLMKGSVLRLPSMRRTRLQALFDKAILPSVATR
jgi:hypothetical protein